MDLNLQGKRALVCGSSQGIGKACAIELSKLGASVILCSRKEEKLIESLKELDNTKNQKHGYLVADFSDPESLQLEIKKILDQPIHILVNNSGGPDPGMITKASIESFQQAFNAHLLCSHILVQELMEGMIQEKYGRIINIISTSVKIPLKNLGVSNTIRGAVANWSKTMANELAKHQITVNNVLPGATRTERLSHIVENKSKKEGLNKEEVEGEMLKEIPMSRFGLPIEIANVVAFLSSPAASYVTGINFPVDGGRTGSL